MDSEVGPLLGDLGSTTPLVVQGSSWPSSALRWVGLGSDSRNEETGHALCSFPFTQHRTLTLEAQIPPSTDLTKPLSLQLVRWFSDKIHIFKVVSCVI